MENRSSCNLFDIADYFPRSIWQVIFDQAIDIVRLVGDKGPLNSDGTPRKSLFFKPVVASDEQQFQVYMIDFGICRFRTRDESVPGWNRKKSRKDEESAVGSVMKTALAKHGFNMHFEEFLFGKKYDRWAKRKVTINTRFRKVEVRPGKFMWILPSPNEET